MSLCLLLPSLPRLEAWGRLLSPVMSAMLAFDQGPDLSRLSAPNTAPWGFASVCYLAIVLQDGQMTELGARNCEAPVFPSPPWWTPSSPPATHSAVSRSQWAKSGTERRETRAACFMGVMVVIVMATITCQNPWFGSGIPSRSSDVEVARPAISSQRRPRRNGPG
jgi:hypothetical protein